MKKTSKSKKRVNNLLIVGLMCVTLAITMLNVLLIFNMTSNQINTLGKQKIESITTALQGVIEKAVYMENSLAESVQALVDENIDYENLEKYIIEQSNLQKELTNGNCFNVCFTSPGRIIVPGYDVAADFDIMSRIWYQGVMKVKKGDVYISSPYQDLATGDMCFSVAKLLRDDVTAVSLDFNMDRVSKTLELDVKSGKMVLVNADGMIVCYEDENLLGLEITNNLPDFGKAFDSILLSNEAEGSFSQGKNTYFYNRTENNWYIIYGIDRNELYKDSYNEAIRNAIFSIIVLVVIIVLLARNRKSRDIMRKALEDRDEFFGNLSGELNESVDKIINASSLKRIENSSNVSEDMKEIRDSALKLSGVIENLFAYSGIRAEEKKDIRDAAVRKKKKYENSNGELRNGRIVVILLLVVFLCTVIFTVYIIIKNGVSEMNNSGDSAYANLTQWMANRKNMVDMLADTIEARPNQTKNYDEMVSMLNSIKKSNEDIGLIYIGNEYADKTVIMSDGWEAGNGYVVQAYSWYSDALMDDEGYNISQPFFDTFTRSYYITISEVLHGRNGIFLGVLAVDFYLEGLTSQLEAVYSDSGYEFLVTDSGSIVNHPNRDYKISTSHRVNIDETEYKDAYRKGEVVSLFDYDGRLRLCLVREDAISGFKVILLRDWNSIYGGAVISASLFIILFAICIILIAGNIFRMSAWNRERNQILQQAVEDAKDADEAKSRFLAQISHELRTPINAVLGMDEMILRDSKDSTVNSYAEDIQSAGYSLLELVNTLLDFSKIENDRMEILPVEYSLEKMLNDTVNTVKDRAAKANLDFKINIDETLPSVLFGDDLRIRQVMVNLLTNAIKYTREGSVIFTVKKVSVDKENISIGIYIEDTGIGIKEEEIKNLCTSFTRLDIDKNRNIEGTGLGLFIVNRFLLMMDSKLEIESTYGKGSEFSFIINQKIIDEKPIGSEKNKAIAKDDEKNKNFLIAPDSSVLIVDDNSMNLKVAAGLLKRTQIQVMTCTSGYECLDYLELNDFDIIFLDHMMPEMDGIQTLNEIKNRNLAQGVPVIVMTANAIVGAREEYLQAGFDDYISKPIDSNELEDMLEKWLPDDKVSHNEASEEKKEVKEVEKQKVNVVKKEKTPDKDAGDMSENEVKLFEELLSDVNYKKGIICCCGTKDFYYEMIHEFVNTDFEKTLGEFIEKSDMKNYGINVHAMKGNARSLGADALGEQAYELELAAKAYDEEKVKELHPHLMDSFRDFKERIDKYFQEIE